MASVTFPTEYGGSGITITDDADPQTGLDGTGYITRFVPALQQGLAMTGHAVQKAGEADSSAQTATSAAQQASADRDSINLDLQTLNGLVADADASAVAAAGSATTASNMADAVAQATATYASVSAGLAATADTEYFRVIEAPEAERVSVYRNDAGSATPITTYYTKTGVDARQAAAVRLNRSLQRGGDLGQTLHSDFAYNAYGLGGVMSGGVDTTLEGEELFTVNRFTPKFVWQPSGPKGEMRLTEVAPNTLARAWNPETGESLGALIEPSATNFLTFSGFQNGLTDAQVRGGLISAVTTGWNGELPQNGIAFAHDGSVSTWAYKGFGLVDGINYTFSVFIEMDDGLPPVFNTGQAATDDFSFVLGGAQMQPTSSEYVGSGVYRVSAQKTGDATANVNIGVVKYVNNTNRTFKVSGYQLEQGTVATSYIPTNGAPVTRAADDVSRTLGGEFNAEQGTVLVSFDTPINYTGHKFAATLGDSNFDRVSSGLSSGTGVFAQVRGSSGITAVGVSVTPGSKVFVAISYNNVTGDCAFAVNGVSNVGVNTFTTNNPRLLIGSENASAKLSSTVNYCKYIPRALSAAELEELTAI